MTTIAPSVELLSKLGTIVQLVDEANEPNKVDLRSARLILADPEVVRWLDRMHELGFLNYHAE